MAHRFLQVLFQKEYNEQLYRYLQILLLILLAHKSLQVLYAQTLPSSVKDQVSQPYGLYGNVLKELYRLSYKNIHIDVWLSVFPLHNPLVMYFHSILPIRMLTIDLVKEPFHLYLVNKYLAYNLFLLIYGNTKSPAKQDLEFFDNCR